MPSEPREVSVEEILKEAKRVDANIRVYEYTDDEGNTYWSFHRHDTMITPMIRMNLKSRLGTHVLNFLSEMRRHTSGVLSLEP